MLEDGDQRGTHLAIYTTKNGMVERKIVTLRDRGMAMLFQARLTAHMQGKLWAEAVSTSEKLTNSMTNSKNNKATPHQLMYDNPANIFQNLKEFGRIGYIKNPKKHLKKFADKTLKAIMIGYADNH